jgi:hypothetical protein
MLNPPAMGAADCAKSHILEEGKNTRAIMETSSIILLKPAEV